MEEDKKVFSRCCRALLGWHGDYGSRNYYCSKCGCPCNTLDMVIKETPDFKPIEDYGATASKD